MTGADYVYKAMENALAAPIAAVGLVFILVAVGMWINALSKWDGDYTCDQADCDTCPFPCDKHTERRE